MEFIKQRFLERSTWLGLGGMCAAAHYWFTDVEFEAFITMLTGISGFIATIVPDKK